MRNSAVLNKQGSDSQSGHLNLCFLLMLSVIITSFRPNVNASDTALSSNHDLTRSLTNVSSHLKKSSIC